MMAAPQEEDSGEDSGADSGVLQKWVKGSIYYLYILDQEGKMGGRKNIIEDPLSPYIH